MIYDDYLTQAELQRWILDVDVAWDRIDAAVARAQPELLEEARDSALIESYFPVYTTKLVRALWDHVDATAVFSIQLYESYKHFYVLNRYLEIIDYRPISEAEIVDLRRRNLDGEVADPVSELARYMISEHFAAYFFARLSRLAKEPTLSRIAGHIAKDEFRHTQFAFELLEPLVRHDEDARRRVLTTGLNFRHVGADAVPKVPISEKNDLAAILTLNKKLGRLCGQSLSDFAKGAINANH